MLLKMNKKALFVNLVVLSLSLFSNLSYALDSLQVKVELATAPLFTLDSNKPCEEGPSAAHVGIRLINTTSNDTLSNVEVFISSYSDTTRLKLLGPLDSTVIIGDLNPGDTGVAYFYFTFPCDYNIASTFNFSISDDDTNTVSASTVVTTKSMQSAAAGGNLISRSVGTADVLGSIMTDTVTYDFGNISKSGDNVSFNPNGDSLFRADDLLLVGSEVSYSAMPLIVPVGVKNQLYFINDTGKYTGTSHLIIVIYYYVNKIATGTTVIAPYAYNQSGNGDKYTSNYGTGVGSDTINPPSSLNPFTIVRTLHNSVASACDTIKFTVDIINTSNVKASFDQLVDSLPYGYEFIGVDTISEINENNSAIIPSNGDTGKIYFKGKPTGEFPYKTYVLDAGDTFTLVYNVKIPCSSTDTGIHVSQSVLEIGSYAAASDDAEGCAGCLVLPVSLIEFKALQLDSEVVINWTTASELNNKYFELSRSIDGNSFNVLGVINGRGTTNEITNYRFSDIRPTNTGGSLYYKLKQVDFDGKYKEYLTNVKLQTKSGQLVVTPNPFESNFTFSCLNLETVYTARLIDMKGQEIWTSEIKPEMQQVSVELNSLIRSGYYILEVISRTVIQRYKVYKL